MVGISKTTRSDNGNNPNRAGPNSTQPKDLLVFLDFFNELSNERQYECLQNELKIPDTKVNTIGLKCILQLSKQHHYINIDALLTDINFLTRSYMIHFKNKSPRIYEKAKKFQKVCSKEATTIRKCPYCYESWKNDKSKNNAYFKLVCPKPHLLVLRKHITTPTWPVKLFHIKDGKASIECFGDHGEDDIPISECFLYSNETPREKSYIRKKQEHLDLAYKEVEEHIRLIKEKFGAGSFVPAADGIPVSNLEQHLKDMFPGVYTQTTTSTTDDIQRQTQAAFSEELFFGEPSTSNSSTCFNRHLCAPLATNKDNSMESDESIDSFSDSDEWANQNHAIKLEDSFEFDNVVENIPSYDCAQDNELQVDNDDLRDSTLNESQPTVQKDAGEISGNDLKKGIRKCRTIKNRTNPVPNKKARSSVSVNSQQPVEDEIITLDDDDTEQIDTTQGNTLVLALEEYEDVIKQIYDLRGKLEKLETRKDELGKILLRK